MNKIIIKIKFELYNPRGCEIAGEEAQVSP